MTQTNEPTGVEEQAAQEVHRGCSTGMCGVTYRQAPEQPADPTDYIGVAAQMLMCDRGDLAAGLVVRLELADRMTKRAGGVGLTSRMGVAMLIISFQDANPHSSLVIPR